MRGRSPGPSLRLGDPTPAEGFASESTCLGRRWLLPLPRMCQTYYRSSDYSGLVVFGLFPAMLKSKNCCIEEMAISTILLERIIPFRKCDREPRHHMLATSN
jgi:hypothetical protein